LSRIFPEFFLRGVSVSLLPLERKVKGPELGISGPALRGVGGGRGLAARDAVYVGSILAI
jgi:hypothetical protein